ncbi:hypothetical protein F7725_012651 [Dissostichus mawsoni]|uniref:Acyl-CoA dehydrogenase n=1 Tax=Dissostichus mawsoni TaxID=36200 RepID=A0A7J5YQ73_DISMA|nr:hypothetical protein F7725_012651 [Dissostichus mawsoni]
MCAVPPSLIHIRSARLAEPGTRRSEEEPLWEETGNLPFSRAKIGSFIQERPVLKNPFLEDALLRGYLRRHVPHERVANEVDEWGRECEITPPRLVHFDPWGRRVDHIVTSSAWKRMKDLSAQEGLVAIGYESRVYQMSKLYIFSPSSGLYTCPLAMTDGAAKVIQSIGVSWPVDEAYSRLTTRQPERFWTSGQWMTERQGGSDVGRRFLQTSRLQVVHLCNRRRHDSDSGQRAGQIRSYHPGSRGLSLFYAEVSRGEDGRLKGIEVQRLKDKLGTRQMPTAELLLDGLQAHRAFLPTARGLSIFSYAPLVVQLAGDYATRRTAFGKLLKDHPLHMQTLARMEVETRGAFLLVMDVCRLLGREESGVATELDAHLLRLLTPVVKLYTGKQAVAVVSEGLESFGGQGYIEDTGLPGLLRDAQSLLAGASSVSSLSPAVKAVDAALSELKDFVQVAATREPGYLELAARDLAFSLARIYTGGVSRTCVLWRLSRRGCYDPNTAPLDAALVYDRPVQG